MATLLQHVRPKMQRAILESEARVEQQMEHIVNCEVLCLSSWLDAFELRVLERLAPTVDVTTLQKEIESLRPDVTVLLAPPKTEPESAPTTSVDDMVLSTLFGDGMPLQDSSRTSGKCPLLRSYF
ncbi:hypothetical protein R3W88_022564 [Solanum pinnatisectum]|uniref:Integrase core domain containing protein n=1 Tax=Solanum pinnatisectum TaxID=50273 RepID=A0AAV9LV35_9SOLN|nr:hypothetical protein R3W88_022564 [Solanum pinnatisectum]